MSELDIKVGRVVYSQMGRDKGRYYLIYKVLQNDYALIVDGEIRKLANPKKKNIKHLKLTYDCFDIIAGKFESDAKVFDKEVASALRTFNKNG